MSGPGFAPRFDVRISGLTLAADVTRHVLSLVVETDLDLAGTFSIVLENPDNTLLDSPLLDSGRTVEIHIGYGNELHPAFLGEIVAVAPSFGDGPSTVHVSGYDRSYRMRHGRPDPTEFAQQNDSVIAARIAAENGLVPVVDPTPGLPQRVSQVECDMTFLKERARQHGFDVFVRWDRLYFQLPRPRTSAHVLEWGRTLSSFSPRISTAGAAGLQVVRDYNQQLAQSVYAAALATDLSADDLLERLGSTAVDMLGSVVKRRLRGGTVSNPLSAAALARALISDVLEGLYEGSGATVGLPELTAGDYVQVRGVGRRFSGTYRLRRVTHRIDGGGFRTEFSITQRGQTSLLGRLRRTVTEEPAPDRTEPFYGVLVGEVRDNHELGATPPGPGLGRVRVALPGLSDKYVTDWAPCATPMGGKGSGFHALPEKGEQVLVAFEQGRLDRPYVLGSLHDVTRPPPERNANGRNDRRVVRSRSGHTITFDDTEGAGSVRVEDCGGSSVTLNSKDGSVQIRARGDLTISAGGTITLQAAGDTGTTIAMDGEHVDVS